MRFFRISAMADAPVDLSHLARYTGDRKAERRDPETVRRPGERDGGQLRGVLELRDARRWREVTHTIKGAARGVGAFAMGDAAADAEPVDPAANPDRAIEAIEVLRIRGDAVQAFIAAYLAA